MVHCIAGCSKPVLLPDTVSGYDWFYRRYSCKTPIALVIDKTSKDLIVTTKPSDSTGGSFPEYFEIGRVLAAYLDQANKWGLRRHTPPDKAPVPLYLKFLSIEADIRKTFDGGIDRAVVVVETETVFPFSEEPRALTLVGKQATLWVLGSGGYIDRPSASSALSLALEQLVPQYYDWVFENLGAEFCA